MSVKLIDWFDDFSCLGMVNQPINGSQDLPLRKPVKPIILSQLINMIKVDYQSHNKEEYNAVVDKELFKSTN
jgi:hypothetical protein